MRVAATCVAPTAIGTMFNAATAWILEYWLCRLGRALGQTDIEPLTCPYWDAGRNVTAQYLLAVEDTRRSCA
jgi:amidase